MGKKLVILIIFLNFCYSMYVSLRIFYTGNVETLIPCCCISLLCLGLQRYFLKKDSKFYNEFVKFSNSFVKYSIYVGLGVILIASLTIDDSHLNVVDSKLVFYSFCLNYLLIIDLIVLICTLHKYKKY